ncbi:hypothetical protein FAM09_18250 [Niastella caeni]|uniref:Uncharacterized protein n=1 Tax=Niastella caeni TaxID=2569763 RepID=A0A4S8HNS9_9BACT|nr:hypothetical protein [Niastella caeni]THU36905.1 hypothetical protein FAM09_18250 [Niastella caeni]
MFQSYYSLLLLALKARIQQSVPEILLVEQDWSQLENYDTQPAVSWPCVLIDFITSDFGSESELVQWGNVTIQLRLAFPPVTAPDTVGGQALACYEIEAKLYKALQGWQPEDQDGNSIGQELTRLQVTTEQGREDDIRVRTLLFTTGFEDASASPVYTIESPDFDPTYYE